MVKNKYEIIWGKDAKISFNATIKYIRKESPEGAKKVRLEILNTIKSISENPLIFEPDRFRTDKDDSFRAFTVYHYRITYKITPNNLQIVRIRHTSQEPLGY